MSGNAVVDKLVGIDNQYANEYYKAAIDAAAAIMTNGSIFFTQAESGKSC